MIPTAIRQTGRPAERAGPALADLAPIETGWHPGPPPPPAEQSAGPGRFIAFLKYHWVLILFLGSVLSAGMAFIAWSTIPSKYTTYALLRVSLRPEAVAFQTEDAFTRNDFNTYLKTQAQLVKSQFVLTAALRDASVANLPMLKSQIDPIQFLEEKILVDFSDGSEIIKISLTGEDPDQIAKIVNAVQGAYYREVVQVEHQRKSSQLTNLQDVLKGMEDTLKKRYESLQHSEQPLVIGDGGEVSRANQVAASQLVKLQDRLYQTDEQLAMLKRRVEDLRAKASQPPPEPEAIEVPLTEPEIALALKGDAEFQEQSRSLSTRAAQLNIKADYLAGIAANPNAPSIIALRREAAAMQAQIEELRKAKAEEYKAIKRVMAPRELKDPGYGLELVKAERELLEREAAREVTLAEITRQELIIRPQAEPGQPIRESPDLVRAEIQQRETKIREVIDKVQILELEVKAKPRVEQFQTAGVPRQKDFKKQLLGTGFAGLLGFVMVGLGVVAYESRLKRVMSLADVKHAAAGPVLGVVPLAGGGDNEPATGPAWANGRQMTEAIDKTRTLAMLSARPGMPFALMITSANTDEGKSFLAWKLTLSLAKAGYKTLLVDADLRSPSLHENVGIPNEQGACEVLRGEADLRGSIQPVNDGLSFLPAGKWDENVRQDLAGERLAVLFARLRESYDCVVVHSSAILSVTDTFLIGRHVDATLLTTQRNVTRMPLLALAQDRVQALNQPSGFGLVYIGATEEEALI